MSGRVATDIAFSNVLLVASLWTVKEWLLAQNVGAFWVLMRILACCALGRVLREVASGGVPKALAAASSAKVRARLTVFRRGRRGNVYGLDKVDYAGDGLRGLFSPAR